MIFPGFLIVIICVSSCCNRIVTGDLILSSLNINSKNVTKIKASNKLLVTAGQFDTIYLKNTGTSCKYFPHTYNIMV